MSCAVPHPSLDCRPLLTPGHLPSSLDGTKLPPSCPQPDSFAASSTMSEDCLSIVVYQPPGNLQNVPVFVWIHGGSFIAGSASAPGLDGRAFAKANGAVVVVVQVSSVPP